jgi:hypothetical protein
MIVELNWQAVAAGLLALTLLVIFCLAIGYKKGWEAGVEKGISHGSQLARDEQWRKDHPHASGS